MERWPLPEASEQRGDPRLCMVLVLVWAPLGAGDTPWTLTCHPAHQQGAQGLWRTSHFLIGSPLQPFKAVFFSASRKFRVLKNLGRELLPSEKAVNDPLFSVRLLPGGSSGHVPLQGSDYERVEIGFKASGISQKPFPRAAAVAHL